MNIKAQKHIVKKTFLAILFLVLFSGEVLFSVYGNYQNSDETALREEQNAIDNWRKTNQMAVFKQKELQNNLDRISVGSEQKMAQNQKVLDADQINRKLYDDKLIEDSQERARLQKEYDNWEIGQLESIRNFYARKRERSSEASWLGLLSGLQLGLVSSLTAIGLAYLAGRPSMKEWRQILLLLSFLAQIVACTTAWYGLMAKYDDQVRAWLFAGTFALCAPAVYHFGLIEWKNDDEDAVVKQPEVILPVAKESEPKAQIETETHKEVLTLAQSKTKITAEVPISEILRQTEEPKPDSWEMACILIKQGQLKWSERDVIRNFPKVSRYRVRERLKTLSPPLKDISFNLSTSKKL